MVSLPAPRTWATNDEPTAQMLNIDLRDAYGVYWNVPRVRVYKATGQSLATSTRTVLTWDTEVFDSDGMWSSGNNSRLTVVTAGIYEITAHIEWEIVNNADNGHRYIAIMRSNSAGTTFGTANEMAFDHQIQKDSDASGSPQTNHLSILKECTAGQYFEVLADHTANTTVDTIESAGSRTFFSMLWLGTV